MKAAASFSIKPGQKLTTVKTPFKQRSLVAELKKQPSPTHFLHPPGLKT
jgi:hypothetical protein